VSAEKNSRKDKKFLEAFFIKPSKFGGFDLRAKLEERGSGGSRRGTN